MSRPFRSRALIVLARLIDRLTGKRRRRMTRDEFRAFAADIDRAGGRG